MAFHEYGIGRKCQNRSIGADMTSNTRDFEIVEI